MARPYVTALVDTYNHERFIEEAIVSVLEQDFPSSEMEVVVVDDGSTDRTPEIVRKFEPRVRLIRKTNGGQASAFNAGIPAAAGTFLSFLDGDDWWAHNKITRAMETFEAEPELGFVGHGDIIVYADGRQVLHVLREGCRFRANTLEGALQFRLRKAFLGTCRMTVRASVLRQILPVPEVLTIQADEYMFTLAATLCEIRILPEPLFYYRMHDSNAFQMSSADPKLLRRKYQVLAELARHLSQELRQRGVDPRAVRAIAEAVQVEGDQLRLILDGGSPWETVVTELGLMRILYRDASFWQHVFSCTRLLPAMVMPPRAYYRWRHRFAQAAFYQSFRRKYFPFPVPRHVRREERPAR
jgi:GT2 family glycosyltransferase